MLKKMQQFNQEESIRYDERQKMAQAFPLIKVWWALNRLIHRIFN